LIHCNFSLIQLMKKTEIGWGGSNLVFFKVLLPFRNVIKLYVTASKPVFK